MTKLDIRFYSLNHAVAHHCAIYTRQASEKHLLLALELWKESSIRILLHEANPLFALLLRCRERILEICPMELSLLTFLLVFHDTLL